MSKSSPGRSNTRSLRVNGPSGRDVSGEIAREDLLEPEGGVVSILLTQRLLEHEPRPAAVELERGDLVVEPRLVVHIAPAHRRVSHPGAACERPADGRGRLRGHEAHDPALLGVERVAE